MGMSAAEDVNTSPDPGQWGSETLQIPRTLRERVTGQFGLRAVEWVPGAHGALFSAQGVHV